MASSLVPSLKTNLRRQSRTAQAKVLTLKSLSTLRSFADAVKISMSEIKLNPSEFPAVLVDSGNLEVDLSEQVGGGAGGSRRPYGTCGATRRGALRQRRELRSRIVVLNRTVKKVLPVILFRAGTLPPGGQRKPVDR